ncbi:MAG: HAD family hydrolase [Candidatus Phytoplasma pruni]|uniref:HAD family hydrolase n=1 Tax=Poinsettia branch-inducing phytoplasma TaxID=138647 RepID=UPI0003714628|nr:HAD family hydrolase [Poinsettia branch-inducing phytoplasma]WEK82684.1 MAG: HAD family hydrolase [Candidatus Phytoplasma pruni]
MLAIKKRLFFFDIDETLYSNKKKAILPQTKKLILKLSQMPNTILGIATGRNYRNLNAIEELLPLFKYFVLMNGSLTISDGKIIDESPISTEHIEEVHKRIQNYQMMATSIGINKAGLYFDKKKGDMNLVQEYKKNLDFEIDNQFYLKERIYLLIVAGADKDKLAPLLKDLDYFNICVWKNHIDLTVKGVNKYYGIKKIKDKYPDHQLICMGDGSNDIEMLKAADIGIAMGNSLYPKVKVAANIVSPHIDDDKMYDFYEEHIL